MVDLNIIYFWLMLEIISSAIIIIGYVLWNVPKVIIDLREIHRQISKLSEVERERAEKR